MKHPEGAHRLAAAAITSSLVIALSFGAAPTIARADSEDDLAQAQEELAAIGAEYQQLQEELRDAAAALELTSGEIEQTKTKLADAQAVLADGVSGAYKTGGTGLIEILFSSSDFSDFVSRLFYLNKVNDAQAQAIESVKELQDQLEQQQSEQEQRLVDAQEKVDEQAANQERAQALVDSLSDEVLSELEQQASTDSSLAAGMQSAAGADSSASQTPITGTDGNAADTVVDETPGSSSDQTTSNPGSSQPSQGSSDTGSSGSSSGSSTVSSPVAYALAMEGVPYVYGGESLAEGGFDCSGLVYYAYQQIGITLPRTSDGQMSYVRSYGRWTTNVNELQYGDLVFFPGHVAFYVGNGMVFGATTPGQGAGYGYIEWYGAFLGGGQI